MEISNRFGRVKSLEYNLVIFIIGASITLLPFVTFKVVGLGLTIFDFFGGHSMASSVVRDRAGVHKAQATSLYLLFYYTGTSLGGTLGGVFYNTLHWPGVVLLTIILMMSAIGILFNMKRTNE